MPRKDMTYSRRPSHAARAAHARGAREFKKYDTSHIRPKKSKGPKIAAIVVVILLLLGLLFGLSKCFQADNPNLLAEGETVRVEIPEGSTGDAMADILYDAGVINNKDEFTREISIQNVGSQLKPGIYSFEGGTPVSQVVQKLAEGPGVGENALVVPEGYTLNSIAEAVESAYAGSITADEFVAAAKNASAYVDEFPFVKDAYEGNLEGFLFPKTYEVILGSTAEDVVRQMLSQYKIETSSLDYSYAKEQGLSEYDALILASIVEKESTADTRAKVAAVFYNRLTTEGAPAYGMLGSDATTAYEIGGEPDNYDWSTDSPYNTRKHAGLTPTPICSPGLESLQAVCSPEPNFEEYFFFSFWPDDQGVIQYYFDKTYEEHQQTIEKYGN